MEPSADFWDAAHILDREIEVEAKSLEQIKRNMILALAAMGGVATYGAGQVAKLPESLHGQLPILAVAQLFLFMSGVIVLILARLAAQHDLRPA